MYINPSDLDTIQWEPTSICNANCICCPRTDHDTMLTKPWILKFQHHTSEEQYNAVIKSFCDPRLQKKQESGGAGRPAVSHSICDSLTSHPAAPGSCCLSPQSRTSSKHWQDLKV